MNPAKWKTDGVVRPRTVDGYLTTAIAVSEANAGRAVALVYAGFGDGPEVASLIAVAPELLSCCKRAVNESARVHPDFMAELVAAIAKVKP